MAITNEREFEAVLATIRMFTDRYAHAVGSTPAIDKARRQFSIVHDAVKAKQKLSPAMIKQFEEAAAVLRNGVADEKMAEQLYDLSDYLEFHT